MATEDEMKTRLKAEIDRMHGANLENLTRSKESFSSWVISTIKRIWNAIVDSVVGNIVDWLWDVFS